MIDSVVAHEPTGWSSRYFAIDLDRKGISRTCVNLSRVRNYARALGTKAETDKFDYQATALYAPDTDAEGDVGNHLVLLKLKTAYEFFKQRVARARTPICVQSKKPMAKEMQKSVKHDEKYLEVIEKEMKKRPAPMRIYRRAMAFTYRFGE